MIYKIKFYFDIIEYCTAKNELHLLQSYDDDYFLELQTIESIEEITEEEAKTIMINSEETGNKVPLYDLAISNDFSIIASTNY